MIRRTAWNLLRICIGSFIFILGLFLLNGNFKPQKNGFTRKFIFPILKGRNAMANEDHIVFISGKYQGKLFMNTKDPGYLISTDENLRHKAISEPELHLTKKLNPDSIITL